MSYLLMMTFLTNGIQALPHEWIKCKCKKNLFGHFTLLKNFSADLVHIYMCVCVCVCSIVALSSADSSTYMQNHNDTIIKRNDKDRRRKTSIKKYVPLTLLQGFEEVIQGLRMRGSWRPNRNCNILTPNLWPATLCLSRSPDAQPEALGSTLLGLGFLYCNLSEKPQFIRAPRPFGLVWLSLPHLDWNWNSTQLSYVIVQRPLDRPLDL